MSKRRSVSGGDRQWGQFRFSVVGSLLSAPPKPGELNDRIRELSHRQWIHPRKPGEWIRCGYSTIERWYYQARNNPQDPIGALCRKIREDNGTHPSLSSEQRGLLHAQYKEHPDWSYQLHADNLKAWTEQGYPQLSTPSCATVRRYMQGAGLMKRRRRGGRRRTAGAQAAEARFEELEVRSFEAEYVNQLWHMDFHAGSLPVLRPDGQWEYPQLLCILDDHSRLCCHIQWYLSETAENVVHGLSQAFPKRGLPVALMSDNGGAMIAGETTQGLGRLGTVHETTLPYSPYQNAKQEVLWGQIEGRLLAMMSGCERLTLAQLNEATLAWAEMEYNRTVHTELGRTPMDGFVNDKDVGRRCPASEALRLAFTRAESRRQRLSDGTVSIGGKRFEIPSHYRHIKRLSLRYASWDLSNVYIQQKRTEQILQRIYPLDKRKNADGRRRRKAPIVEVPQPVEATGGMAPLMRQLIAEYAATGLPPAYLPKDEITKKEEESNDA